jgi:hypothetical protein
MRTLIFSGLMCGLLSCNSALPTLTEAKVASASAASALVDGARVKADVEALASNHRSEVPFDCTYFDYQIDELQGLPMCELRHTNAQEFVRARFASLGYEVEVREQGEAPFTTHNVIAEIRGTEHPEEVVLIGAHFDAYFQGADDNTSGVAAMLEVARLAAGKSFSRTVRFVGFDLEEFGYVGSTRYVEALGTGEKLHTVIILDCVGFTDKTPGSQQSLLGLALPSTGDFIAILSNKGSQGRMEELVALSRRLEAPPVFGGAIPGDGASALTYNMARSDHAAFWMEGLNTIFITDTANFRNPHYHEETDVPDTLDYEFLAGVTRMLTGGVFYWAGEVQP